MTEIYALQTAKMVGCALEGTAEWFLDFHSPHETHRSALTAALVELDRIRDTDLAQMQAEHPVDQYNEADYNIKTSVATKNSDILELVRRCGTDQIPLAQMVIVKSEVFAWS